LPKGEVHVFLVKRGAVRKKEFHCRFPQYYAAPSCDHDDGLASFAIRRGLPEARDFDPVSLTITTKRLLENRT
jgi:hypothetical protein